MASLFKEYHKQAHEQSAQFGFEATCKTPVQPAQSNIEINHITVHTTFSGTPGLVVNKNVDQSVQFSCLHCVSRLRNITQCQHGGHGAGDTLPLRGAAIAIF